MTVSQLSPPSADLPEISYEALVERASEALPETLPTSANELLFALDIDGTIVQRQGISPAVRRAIATAGEAGAKVVIATGRGIGATRPVVNKAGVGNGWGVCSNGALIVRWDETQQDGHILERTKVFDPHPIGKELQKRLPNAIMAIDDGSVGMQVSSAFPPGELLSEETIVGFDNLLSSNVAKLVVRDLTMTYEDFLAEVNQVDFGDLETAVGWTSWIDVGPTGVTKASGLQELAATLDIPASGTIAIGDGMNDIAMLSWAGHGVAMGDAVDAVQQAADAVTGSVEQDGAAAVIDAVLSRY